MKLMERRELLKMIALLTGGVMIGSQSILSGCHLSPEQNKQRLFTEEEIQLLNEISESILPETNTPGAKAANVGAFMALMVSDCYEAKDQKIFKQGMKDFHTACEKMYKTSFMQANATQRLSLLVKLDKEAKDYPLKKAAMEILEREKDKDYTPPSIHYFQMMKQLTLLGYFTSKIGCTQALRYEAVPGRYEGSVPYQKGDKAWA